MAAAVDFVQRKNPVGLYYAIKKNAKMARSRIYDKIAQRNGGRLISLPDRKSLKGVRLVWFR
jgi:predicted DNA-binding transcriptional regulator AlpA